MHTGRRSATAALQRTGSIITPQGLRGAAALAAALTLGAGTLAACGGYTANASPQERAPTHAAARTAARAVSHPAPAGNAGPSQSTVAAIQSAALPPLPPMGSLVPPGAVTRSTLTAAPGARRGVAVFGDSLVLQSWAYLHRIARDRGQPFDGGAYGGTALCDWLNTIHRVLGQDKPGSLVLAFAGNNLTPCTLDASGRRQYGAPLIARYRADTLRAISEARHAHTTIYLVGPASMRDHVWNDHASRLRHMLSGLAAQQPGVVYVDAHAALSPNGFHYSRPCLNFETAALGCHAGTIVVRANDGVHLVGPVGGNGGYSAGGWRFASLLLHGVPNAR